MRPNVIVLLALIIVSAGVLAAGCTTPGENVTPAETPPAETETPSAIETTPTEIETETPSTTETTPTEIETETPSTTETTPTEIETGTATPATGVVGGATTIDLVARDTAFDQSTITVPAGSEVTINFDNEDDNITHNFAVYNNSTATDLPIYEGAEIVGPNTTTYTFTAPDEPGTYYFQCDVHPEQMNGDLIVE